MARNLQPEKRVAVRTLARKPKYGTQTVGKIAPSTGIYGKRVGGTPSSIAVRIRKGR